MTRPNIFNTEFQYPAEKRSDPGYDTAEAPFGTAAGGQELVVRLYELPAGQSLCPYHYESVEEWLLMIRGEVHVRTPTGTEAAQAGDLICFPAGRDGAHKVTNDGSEPARLIMFSRDAAPLVAVYPDSDKVGVWTADKRDRWMFRGEAGQLDYLDGEPMG